MAKQQEATAAIAAYFAKRESEPVAPMKDLATRRLTQACALVDRFAPQDSAYLRAKDKALKTAVLGSFDTVPEVFHLKKIEEILRGLQEDIASGDVELSSHPAATVLSRIEWVLSRFDKVVRRLSTRRVGSEPLTMDDEYDVQYLLDALLSIDFDDVRPEEWTPGYAGSSGKKMDFLLKDDGIVVETKKTRSSLKARKLGEELVIDIAHYKTHPDCKTLVCFVYDPDQFITNAVGMRKDLEKLTTPTMKVCVIICQG